MMTHLFIEQQPLIELKCTMTLFLRNTFLHKLANIEYGLLILIKLNY
jgi:hypothetical protein